MTKVISFCVSMLLLGAAQAMEVHAAPIPEPNYLGIFIFLVLFIGGSGWYIWRIMTKETRDKQARQIQAK